MDIIKPNQSLSIAANLEETARALHPSLLLLFSHRRRTIFQTLLYPSNAERLAFRTTVPLLVMGKNER